MRDTRLLVCAFVALTGMSSVAGAAQRSSFINVDSINNINAPTSAGGQTYNVAVGLGPSFTIGANNYTILSVIGFYVLSNTNDFTPLSTFSAMPGPFVDDSSNAGVGGAGGWQTIPTGGLTPSQSMAFTLPAGFSLGEIDQIGYEVRVSGVFPSTTRTVTDTGFITRSAPAPGAAALLGLGALAASRRRRR